MKLEKLKRPLVYIILASLTLILVLVLTLSITVKVFLNIPFHDQVTIVYRAYIANHDLKENRTNLIVLGLDERNDSFENTKTTDTIIFTSLNSQSGIINLLSLPRDLWDDKNQSKINQIYQTALLKQNKNTIKPYYSLITGQSIDYYLVVNTQNLVDIINILGGIDLYLDTGFRDQFYPNSEYIKDPSSGAPIYKTIEFPAGLIHLDKNNVTEFVRSRKSSDDPSKGGTDLGRINRQQLLISAIFGKIQLNIANLNFKVLSKLLDYYQKHIDTDLGLSDIAALTSVYLPNYRRLSLNRLDITPLIYHPDRLVNRQWVFMPVGDNYDKIQQYISQGLK